MQMHCHMLRGGFYIFHVLFISIILHVHLILLTFHTNLIFKLHHDIDTAIVSLLFLDLILHYLRNLINLRFLLHRELLYYHNGELIQGQIIFAPILKTRQEPPPPRDTLNHASQLLTHPSLVTCPYLLLQLTYLGFYYRPLHDIVPLALRFYLFGKGGLRRNNKI